MRNYVSILLAAMAVAATLVAPARGQQIPIPANCTASLISSFTPCLNYLTGSTNGSASPTSDCCSSLSALISSSKDCACLILTGNAPLSLPINRTMAITLPRVCKSTRIPLKCKDASAATPLPGSGPGPSLPPLSPSAYSPTPTVSSEAPSPSTGSRPPAVADAPSNVGQRPIELLPSSSVKLSSVHLPFFLLGIAAIL